MVRKNPSLKGKTFSNPVVTNALTHGLRVCAELFADKGDRVVVPDLYWDNYALIFGEACGAKIETFNTFRDGCFDAAAMKKALLAAGYVCEPHAARQTTRADYGQWDYIIGMDDENMWDMKRIYGGDPDGKLSMLLSWAGQPGREIDDPWYTRDFNGVLKQIEEGCRGLLKEVCP